MDWGLAVAILGIIIELGYSYTETRGAEMRTALQTEVSGLFQLLRDKFGITKDQLSQFAEKLDIHLNQLTDSTRGSARLSTASKKLRDFLAQYPELKDKVNKAINKVSDSIKSLGEAESLAVAKINKREGYGKGEFVEAVAPIVSEVNTTLTDFNNSVNDKEEKPNIIDTNLGEAYDKQTPPANVYGDYQSDFSPGNETI